MFTDRYDLTVPAHQRKLEIVIELEALAIASNLNIIELSLAFVLEHPAISSAIIGPRTMEQLDSQLHVHSIRLETEVLDRIDELVPPGTNVSPNDVGWISPTLASARRRRPRP